MSPPERGIPANESETGAFPVTQLGQKPQPLPITPAAEQTVPLEAAHAAIGHPAPQQVAPRRCLVVDDSRMIRKVSRRIVETLGYQVSEVENGEEALARCKSDMPDLILLDWNMPVMSGLEFVAALRALGGHKRPHVVFCTSNSDQFNIHKGFEAGADEYVVKPFDAPTLLAKLQRIGAG